MGEPLRKVAVSEDVLERLETSINADSESIGIIIHKLLQEIERERRLAWTEARRLASVDRSTEECVISWVSGEILVYPKGHVPHREDGKDD